MAGVKISQLPAVIAAQLTDYFPVVQAGVTSRETVQQLATLLGTPGNLPYVPIAGGTMSGPLILSGDATNPLGAVTLEQLQLVAGGFTVILAALVATTANLSGTYANGAAGVGATLTNNGVQVALTIDGVLTVVGNRVLVKNQTAPAENGVYQVSVVGTGATNWVLTRVTDYDTAAEIKPGTLIAVNSGTVNATTSWLETATVVTVGTDPILFSQFTFSPGAFLLKANNLSDVASVATSLVNLGLGTPTGTYPGNVVMQTSPTLITPTLGVATATSLQFSPTTNGIIGTNTNDSAIAGRVGEYISSSVLTASAVPVVNNVAKTITTITLSAGDWDVSGSIVSKASAGTILGYMYATISFVNNTLPTFGAENNASLVSAPNGANNNDILCIGPMRISVAGPTTIYLVTHIGFSVSTMAAYGFIGARRVR